MSDQFEGLATQDYFSMNILDAGGLLEFLHKMVQKNIEQWA